MRRLIRRLTSWLSQLLAILGVLRVGRLLSTWATTPNKPKLVDWRAKGKEDDFNRVEIWSRGLFRAPLRIEILADGTERRSVADEILVRGHELPKKIRFKGIALKRVGEECDDYQLYRLSKLSVWFPKRPKLRDWLPEAEKGCRNKYGIANTERNEVFSAAGDVFEEQWGNELVRVKKAQDEVLATLRRASRDQRPEVKIAIIDSGIDPDHVEWGEYDSCIDKDNSKSFLSRVCCLCRRQPEYRDERHSHGTACSGLIAAKVDPQQQKGLEGVALSPSLMVVKFLDRDGLGTAHDACRSIRHAVKEKARILLLAWGGSSPSPIVEKALEYAMEQNVVVVAAAGNRRDKLAKNNCASGKTRCFYPASYRFDNMLVVGATTREENDYGNSKESFAPGTNYGPHVDLGAPGLLCKTTRIGHRGGSRSGSRSPRYSYFSGTSAAAAYVAGTCALVWLKLKLQLGPCKNPRYQDVLNAILRNSNQKSCLPFKCCRRLDAYQAVANAVNTDKPVDRCCPETDACADYDPYPDSIIAGD